MLTFQALANIQVFSGMNQALILVVDPTSFQADLFLKIYSSIWLSQKFLGYITLLSCLALALQPVRGAVPWPTRVEYIVQVSIL
jgi:hypothetical protein